MAPRSAWLQREMRQQFVPVRWRLRSERWARELGCRLRRRWPGWVHLPLRPRPGPRRRRRLRRWRRRRRGVGGWCPGAFCDGGDERRVDFSAPVPPSKRIWATLGGWAMGGGGSGGGRRGGRSDLSRCRRASFRPGAFGHFQRTTRTTRADRRVDARRQITSLCGCVNTESSLLPLGHVPYIPLPAVPALAWAP